MAFGEEKFSKSVGINEGNDCTCQTAPSRSNTNRPKFVKTFLVFVESQEPAEGEQLGKLEV